jgi:hypothetical protein
VYWILVIASDYHTTNFFSIVYLYLFLYSHLTCDQLEAPLEALWTTVPVAELLSVFPNSNFIPRNGNKGKLETFLPKAQDWGGP